MSYFRVSLTADPHSHNAAMYDTFDMEVEMLNLERDGLGHELMDMASASIIMQCAFEADPDGVPWPALDPRYAAEKKALVGTMPMGVLHGLMLSFDQVDGVRDVHEHDAEQYYGTDPVAIAEAVKFTMGGAVTGTAQPPRPFYAFNAISFATMDPIVDRHFASYRLK